MPKNIILIDKRVQDYETILAAIDTNICIPVLFDYYTDTIADIKGRILEAAAECIANDTIEADAGTPRCIGLLQHNYNRPFYNLVAADTEGSVIMGVTDHDPELATWAPLRDLIAWCATTPEINAAYFDMMACALYSNPDWKYIIDKLTEQTGATIRASTDDTGSAAQGGDWFLESHTGVNLKGVYFTEAIEEYRGILYLTTPHQRREYSTKGFATGSVVTWGSAAEGGNSTTVAASLSSGVVAIYSTEEAFAALKSNGSVITWGGINGGNSTTVAASLSSNVVAIYSSGGAFAALKSNGSVITWGSIYSGGDSTTVAASLSSDVVAIYSTDGAFAALKNSGSVVTWGLIDYGGDSSSVSASLSSGVIAIYSSKTVFAALKSNGSVVTWGNGNNGGDSSSVASNLSSGVIAIYSAGPAFAALKSNGSVVTWGNGYYGGDSSSVASNLSSGVIAICPNGSAFAALKNNGSVIAWGPDYYGGNSSSVAASLSSGVLAVYCVSNGFAALKNDGSVITWSGSFQTSTIPYSSLTSDIVSIYSTTETFAGLKSNGSVILWPTNTITSHPANTSIISGSLTSNVIAVYVSREGFAVHKRDTSVVTWGEYINTPGTITTGAITVYSNNTVFASINSIATTYDMSYSYYRDIDRYNIFRKKENRRRANFTTLNNNVFTISQPIDLQQFNPTIPTNKILRIIIPDYVSSISITSTATVPFVSDVNYIVACDEGEPVTISGTTYVNYGTYIYRRETNNTYTQLTSATINNNSYGLYGGDGVNSSGIAFVVLYPPPTISNFPNITKVSNAAPFQITAPTSNSTGAFLYTSSNPSVATISGTTVTIVGFGTSTITAIQASDNANYGGGSITATLTTTSANYFGADLSGSDFTNISLYGATLNLTNLTNAILVSTDLSGATLLGATLANILSRGVIGLATATLPPGYVGRGGSIFGNNVRITSANLTNADLSNVVLTNSDVSGAILTGATLTNMRTLGLAGTATATLPTGYVFRNSIIVGPNVSLVGSALTSADLSGVSIAGADLSGTVLTSANLTNLVSGNLRNASVSATPPTVLPTGYIIYNNFIIGPAVNLSSATLSNLDISGAGVADLTRTRLTSATLTNASLFNMDISGVDLSGATIAGLRSFGLTGGTATATRLPTGYFSRTSTANTGTIVGPAVNLSSLSLQNIDLTGGITLTGANFTNTDISGASTNLAGIITGNLTGLDTATLPPGYVSRNGFIIGPRVVLRSANLSNQNLTGVDLSGVDLSGANLTNAILTNTNLTAAIFTNTTLTGILTGGITNGGTVSTLPSGYFIRGGFIVGPSVNLTSAAATGIDLSGVTITGSTLTNAVLTSATMTRIITGNLVGAATATLPTGYVARNGFIVGPAVILRSANLSSTDLSGISIAGCDISGTILTSATVSNLVSGSLLNPTLATLPSSSYVIRNNFIVGPNVDLSGAALSSQLFTGLTIAGANLTNANLTGATFTNTNITATNLAGATVTSMICGGGITGVDTATLPSAAYVPRAAYGYFIGPRLIIQSANLANIDLSGVSLVGANLTNSNLTTATITNADISGAVLTGTT